MSGFSRRLHERPCVVEVVPPGARATPAAVEEALSGVGTILDACHADAVNVPEILGRGFQSMDPLEFARMILERHDVDVIVNKVVAQDPAFPAWLDRVMASEVASVVLVGGERGGIYYPGPNVLEANRIVAERRDQEARRDFGIGNVTIPSRSREAARMLDKARAGCDYFTSQIIYEAPTANAHLQAYDDLCSLSRLAPRPVLYAFSAAENAQDILFLRYLGVNVPPQVERVIRASDPAGFDRSMGIIEQVWATVLGAARARAVSVPLGVIVETVSRRGAAAAPALLERLRRHLEGPGTKPAPDVPLPREA